MTFWDLAYRDGSYLEHWAAPRVPPELVELVEDGEVGPGATAVDLGCGGGLEAVYLAREGLRVIGVDLSPSALVRARSRAGGERLDLVWCAGDVRSLPLAATSVDLVLDRGCFHLFEPTTRPSYAAQIHRILRPGGRFLLRGARHDDEDRGLFGLDAAELDALFPPGRFRRVAADTLLEAPAGDLPGERVLLRRVL